MTAQEPKPLARQEQIDGLHNRLFALMEQITKDLFRHTLERLKVINPTLDDIADICESMIELLQSCGNAKVVQMNEAVRVLREAAVAVGQGDEKTVTDCAYHIEETMRLYRLGN